MGIRCSLFACIVAKSDTERLIKEGFRYIESKEWKQAEDVLLQVTDVEPSAVAYNALGLVAEKTDRMTDAVIFYTRATTFKPFEAAYWFNLGNALRSTSVDAAVHAYEKALFLKEDSDDVLLNLGLLIRDEQLLRKVRQGRGLVGLARILEENNNDARASAVYQEARTYGYEVDFVLGLCDLRLGNDTELRKYLGSRTDMDDRLAFFVGSTANSVRRARKYEPKIVQTVRAMESQVALQVEWGKLCFEQRQRELPIPSECQYNTVWVDSFDSVQLPELASALVVVGSGLGSACTIAMRRNLPCIGVNVICGLPRGLHDQIICPPWNTAVIPKRAVVLMTTYFWPDHLKRQAWAIFTPDALEVMAWQEDPFVPRLNETTNCQLLLHARVSWDNFRVPLVLCKGLKPPDDLCRVKPDEENTAWPSIKLGVTIIASYAIVLIAARLRSCRTVWRRGLNRLRKRGGCVGYLRKYLRRWKHTMRLYRERAYTFTRLWMRHIRDIEPRIFGTHTELRSEVAKECVWWEVDDVNENEARVTETNDRILVRNTFLHVAPVDEEESQQARTWPSTAGPLPQIYTSEVSRRTLRSDVSPAKSNG